MNIKLIGLLFGAAFGFILGWAHLASPAVIRNMLLLREPDVFLLMGSAIVVAAVGVRLLRRSGMRALATGEAISWTREKPEFRHVAGSAVFGAGWGIACTCPAPLAVMLGEGRLGGVLVAGGILGGVALQGAIAGRRAKGGCASEPQSEAAGL